MVKKLISLIIILVFAIPVYAAEFVPIIHSTTYGSSLVITIDPTKTLYWLTVTWHTAATRWLFVYNSKVIPADGVLDPTKIMYCAIVSLSSDGAPGTKSFDWTNHPLQHNSDPHLITGDIEGTVVFISVDSNGCTTKAADGPNNWITAGFN